MTQPDSSSTPIPPPEPAATGAYSPPDSASELVRVLDQYLADLQGGRPPDWAKLLKEHPQLAAELEQCLAGMDFIHRASRPGTETPTQLGDFRIIREIGHGGMGVVFEAEQLSLKRRVALKVLRLGAVADPEIMQRFQREAETVARLHHTNIVPIFAVGCEQGVHYYAMQLIEGRSLAAIIDESRQSGAVLSPKEIAHWGLQAAEALVHAHQRGVIHRDIKPSNLLLDPEGVVWLTDFGLAKRAGEVTLTGAGLLMGTPRYMSPEQADAVRRPIDYRTDIYSLGATLYELTTGRPVFEADTPHGVITQILTTEPVAPRQVRPGIPRDLETIILKCLHKEAARRYATAQEMASDLRAFEEGRPIKARRPGPVERAVRWARKNRRSAFPAGVAAAAAVLLMVGGYFAWQWYSEWRQGRIVLTTEGPGLEAELLDENGDPVRPPFAVSSAAQPLALPAGKYQVRLSGRGQLSETYGVLVEQGVQTNFDVILGGRQLWEPMEVSRGFEVVELDGRSDVLLVTEKGLWRMNGATGKEVWTRGMNKADQPALAGIKDFPWNNWYPAGWLWRNLNPGAFGPWLVRPASDLKGDGSRCLVLACSTAPWLVAVAARDGTIQWVHESQSPGRGDGGIREPGTGKRLSTPPPVGVVCPPLVEDVDGDGIPDIISTFAPIKEVFYYERNDLLEETPRWVEAISGRTGQPLWRYTFEGPKPVEAAPGVTTEDRVVRYATAFTRYNNQRVVAIAEARESSGNLGKPPQNHLGSIILLDLKTGKPVRPPANLGPGSMNVPAFHDLNRDGKLCVVLVRGGGISDLALVALSLDGATVWEHPVGKTSGQYSSPLAPLTWPVVADLDGTGKLAMVVPFHGADDRRGWVGVEVLDAATGESRWRHHLLGAYRGSGEDNGVAHFLVGPDMDGDGSREVFTAALIDHPSAEDPKRLSRWLLVAASSGADGQTLWQRLYPVEENARLGPLHWGPPGSDGQPLMMVRSVHYKDSKRENSTFRDYSYQTFLLAASSGKLEHTWPGLLDINTADLDGDGIADLYGVRQESDHAGKLNALRGGPPEPWRNLGTWQPARLNGSREERGNSCYVAPAASGDLDGDGIPDVVVFHPGDWRNKDTMPPLQAYSGKDGSRLWKVDVLEGSPGTAAFVSECFRLECRDLDGDGRPEVLFTYRLGTAGSNGECWLAALSGRTGKVLWKEKLGGGFDRRGTSIDTSSASQPPGFWDLSGDGGLDVIFWANLEKQGHELQALDGRTGRLLWKREFSWQDPDFAFIPQTTGDGSVDILLATHSGRGESFQVELLALNGRDGQTKWHWSGKVGEGAHWFLADLDGQGRTVCVQVRGPQPGSSQLQTLDSHGQTRRTLTVPAPANEPLRHHDLDGDGKEEVLFVRNGKVQAVKGVIGKEGQLIAETLWEWPLPGKEGTIVAIQPAKNGHGPKVLLRAGNVVYGLDGTTGKPAWEWPLPKGARYVLSWDGERPGTFEWPETRHTEDALGWQASSRETGNGSHDLTPVVVGPDHTAYGLDGSTGRLRWRCDGPGRLAVLVPGIDPGGLPSAMFHVFNPESTVCRQALPADPDGKYSHLVPTPIVQDSDSWKIVPLPWVNPARQRLRQAALMGALLLGLFAYFGWRRQWLAVLYMVLSFSLIVIGMPIHMLFRENQYALSPEQHYAWGGWYWILPFVMDTLTGLVIVGPPLCWMVVRIGWLGTRRILGSAKPV